MRRALYLLALLALALPVHADDQTQNVQQALKDQGFYYGQVDGTPGPETDAAIRRYQIRQGLEVTGKLDAQTLAALNGTSGTASGGDSNTLQSVPPQQSQTQQQPAQDDTTQTAPSPTDTPEAKVVQSDHDFLKTQPPQSAPQQDEDQAPRAEPVQPEEPGQPGPPPPPGAVDQGQTLPRDYTYFFRKTPYENAPTVVQRTTIHQAQVLLGRRGFFRSVADGELSKGLSHAIAGYQHYAELGESGRLDMDTLADMNLLPRKHVVIRDPGLPPGAPPPPYGAPYGPPGQPPGVYRGIWVH